MGKRKITLNEILYLLFCVFNIYLLPLILGKALFGYSGWKSLIELWPRVVRIWINGFGCFVIMLGAAVYEYYNKKSQIKDGAIWLYIFAVLPHIAFGLISALIGGLDSLTLIDNFQPLIFAGGGIWLGRLASGKYKGIKQFYTPDLLYILGCILVFAVSSGFLFKDILSEEYELYIGLILLLISAVYGRFSEFEYIQERLLRAVMTVSLVFTAAFIVYFCEKQGYASNPAFVFEDFAIAFFKPSATAVIGVCMGYYLRIMRLGGDRAYYKKDTKKTVLKYIVAVSAVLFVPVFIEARYYFQKQVNICEAAGIDLTDAAIISICDSDDGTGRVYTDKDCINKVAEILKTEKGTEVKTLPGRKKSGFYRINVFDKNGAIILYLNMEHKGELSVGNYKNGKSGKYILTKQYYDTEDTKKDDYVNALKNSMPQNTEQKLEFIKEIDCGIFDYYIMQSFFKNYVIDRSKEVRLAAAEKLGSMEYVIFKEIYMPVLLDENAEVKAAAYESLEKSGAVADYNDIDDLVDKEKDGKYRFLAIVFWGKTVREEDKQTLTEYFRGRYENAEEDIDKLAYICALLETGDNEFIGEAMDILQRLPDTQDYEKIKTVAGEIINNQA